jgi:hypothetical protein
MEACLKANCQSHSGKPVFFIIRQMEFMIPALRETSEVPAPLGHNRLASKFAWLGSAWFDLAIAGLVGFVYALIVIGPVPLNPRNTNWVTPDPATYYIGWELFRQDPHIHWPLTFTDRVGYPYGESVALFDLNPVLALALKPLSPLLPEPCQYLGFEVVLLCALQFFFALRLFRLILGANPLGIALSSIFFLLSPPLNYRLVGHYALSNHWLLLAALLVFFQAQQESSRTIRRFVISAVILAGVSVGINPYIAFQVMLLLTGSVATLLWQQKLTLKLAAGIMALLCVTCLATAYSLGFVITGGRGYASSGYRYYSMNSLALFDPYWYGSGILPKLSMATAGQYEGYNYLGAGVLILALIVLVLALLRREKLQSPNTRWLLPLALCSVLLTLMALSTKVTIGSATLLDLDPRERFSVYFAPFRASGRLFWAPYYTMLIAVLAGPFLFLRRSRANLLLAGILLVQLADTSPLRQWVRSTVNEEHPTPLKSPIWSKLGSIHENLIVLPAWQCDYDATPGGRAGYRIFGLLAVAQRMRTNSYYSARYSEVARERECTQSISTVTQAPLSSDSAYVVSPSVATLIAEGPTGSGKCHDLDGFILCSSASNFGLSSTLMSPEVRLQTAIGNSGFENGGLDPWLPFHEVRESVTLVQAHTGTRSLAQTTGAGSVYQDVSGLNPGATYTVTAWVKASPGATATAQIATFAFGASAPTFSRMLTARPDWQLLSQSFTVGPQGAVRIHLFRNQGSGTIYWDDVGIYGRLDPRK